MTTAPGAGRFAGVARAPLAALRGIRWYVREFTGDSAYDRYVQRFWRDHPGDHPGEGAAGCAHAPAEPLTEREFWRQKWASEAESPTMRCC